MFQNSDIFINKNITLLIVRIPEDRSCSLPNVVAFKFCNSWVMLIMV